MKRTSAVDVANGTHGITRGLQHNPSHLATYDIAYTKYMLLLVANVAGQPKTKLPDVHTRPGQKETPSNWGLSSENICVVARWPTGRKRDNGGWRPKMKTPRCRSAASQDAGRSDVSSSPAPTGLAAFSYLAIGFTCPNRPRLNIAAWLHRLCARPTDVSGCRLA